MSKKSCYRITASGGKRATVVIDGVIGDYGNESADFRRDVAELGEIDDLLIKITSRGGDVIEGMGMAEVIANHPAKTHTSIEGVAASMGSVIAMAADKVSMTKNSLFFVHNAQGIAFGDSNEMRKAATALEAVTDALFSYYRDRPNMQLSDEDLKAALDEETYYSAEQALELGFIDQISNKATDMRAVASLGWDKDDLSKLPKEFMMKVTNSLNSENDDGSAVETTEEGKNMTDDKKYSEAEMQAAVDKAVADKAEAESPDTEAAQALVAMLNDDNATIENVRAAADMGLDKDQAAKFMAHMASESTAKVENKEVENEDDKPSAIESMFAKFMKDNEVNNTNTNAGTGDESDKKVLAFDASAEYKRIKEGS